MVKKKTSDNQKMFEKGGRIEYKGAVKEVLDKFENRTLRDNAGHVILNPKEACMDAFNQACKSPKKLLNENGRKGIDVSDLPSEIFRNM